MRTFRGQVDREVVVDLGLGEDNLTGTLDRRVAHVSSQNVHDIHRGLGKTLGAVHQLDGRIRLVLIEHTNSGSDEGSGQSDNLTLDLGVIYTLFQLAQVRDDNRYVNGFTDKLLRQSEIDLGASRDSMPCLLDEKKIVNYPCSRACPLFGDCVTKWYQVRKRA